ncbi:bifunctional Ribosomal protein L11-L12/Ribosomal protein L11 [Babesia duncani]|uniref:Bifunctional Ribosomal protein L11-L12/Ribosomal protein L11 n=1 Tax=Babesia duncani TaxID=323732 RepID=A0AAD9UQT0_9APIC|nr:bifunctional Ribosomal protein L11-L12/Ribosomal protein L11 [Babesia duncani]
MAKKPDPNEIVYVYVRQLGGDVAPSSVLAPKLGPLGMSPKKVGDDIAKDTASWKGIKVTVKLTIQNRQAKIEVKPTATALLIKELKEPLRDRKKVKNIKHSGNLTMDQLLSVARQMRPSSMAKTFKGTVKEILGTCNAIGCTVDKQKPRDLQVMIDNGELEIPHE